MQLTVLQVARRLGKNPETIRRWIREGRLPAQKLGSQHFVDDSALADIDGADDVMPTRFTNTFWGGPMPDWAALVRADRDAR